MTAEDRGVEDGSAEAGGGGGAEDAILAFAEQREGRFGSVAGETAATTARLASELGARAHALAVGDAGLSAAAAELGEAGVERVRVAEHEALGSYHAETYARVVADEIRSHGYRAAVLPATAQGRDLAPRVAALLDVPLATDVTGLSVRDGEISVVRPIYAGKAFAHLFLDASPALVTIRPNVFHPEVTAVEARVDVIVPEVEPGDWKSRVTGFEASSGNLDVAEAGIVVSGGRGLGDPDRWTVIEALRDALGDGAALGASRAVVDAGWRPHAEQVGQTGKTVAPRLYFAVGISGAVQHLAGMRTAGTIVAINKDPGAPIFEVADYGIVGDLFKVVPRLTDEIKARTES